MMDARESKQDLPDISLFTTNILIYETTDGHDDHGIQTRIVSRVLLEVG